MTAHSFNVLSDPSRPSRFNASVYLIFLCLYFFFNSAGLPLGLQYTTLLSPFFYLWLLKNQRRWIVTRFVLCSLPFVAIHMINGVFLGSYITSYMLIMAVYIVAYAFYIAVSRCDTIGTFFIKIIYFNFLFALLAIPFRGTPISDLLWWSASISDEIGQVPRLKLLTYEASYYSTLLVPFFMYGYFRVIFFMKRHDYLLLFMTALPLALSFSFSVIADIALTLAIIHLFCFRKLYLQNKLYMKLSLPIIVVALAVFVFKTHFMARLTDIVTGQDASAGGRVFWSYVLSYYVTSQKSLIWGLGVGQLKHYYSFMVDFMQVNNNSSWMSERLYNYMAELFVATGTLGVLLKLVCEIYLFIWTKAYTNYFRFSLFVFMFLYQFGGSYITNIAEYAIWIFAFVKVFPEFDIIRQGSERAMLHNKHEIYGSSDTRLSNPISNSEIVQALAKNS